MYFVLTVTALTENRKLYFSGYGVHKVHRIKRSSCNVTEQDKDPEPSEKEEETASTETESPESQLRTLR